ncbi:lipocalin family protein [Aestuariibaculum lutulentum]|uniref:Lipocalin family protein n=1 Tax=Aestuariibaculum lutulentum TaxID=2920935 RepID=A0ABS9RLY1_9FLAO|nr:lipocalin family protein [Aestuariibaculum lutulentum]MCH4553556.1 lipocalin family protein [Aestuariibaculum lutulentum]
MKKLLILLLFVCISNTAFSQSNELIVGKWTFKDAYNKDKIDEAGLAMLQSEIINKMTFTFNHNGEFEAYMMGENQKGKWELTKDSKKIILKIPQETTTELTILKLTEKELALKLGLGEFLMTKNI